MVMHLYRQAFARLHGNALHLVTFARIDGVVFAPRPVHFAVNMVLVATVGFDLLYHLFNVLHGVTVGNQHGVFGLDDHQILHPHRGHEAGFGVDVAVLGFVANHITVMDVTLRGMRADLPQGGPGANIAPACIHRHHHRIRRALHHRIVNGLFRAGEESGFVDANKVEIRIHHVHGFFAGAQDIRTILLQFFQIATGAEQEHTAVPVVFTAGNVGLRGFQIRFLNELRHVKRHAVAFARRHAAAADIAIAGFWQIRHDAEGHQLAAFCVRNGRPHCVAERLFLLNDVVCRQDQHQRIAIRAAAFCRQRRQGNGWGGISSGRLQNDVFCEFVQLAQLLGNNKAVLFVTNHHRAFTLHTLQTVNRRLQHGEIPFQAEELFWIEHAGQRPQPATRATCHHNRIQRGLTHDLSPYICNKLAQHVLFLERAFGIFTCHRVHFWHGECLFNSGHQRRNRFRLHANGDPWVAVTQLA
ncbi:hypothetical protein WLF10_03188 [Enterobacter cloacae]